MSFLTRQLIKRNESNKSLATFFKTSFIAANIPRIKQSELFCFVVSLDSPLLIKENIFPKLASAKSKKAASHYLIVPLPTTFSLGIAVIVTIEESEESISIRICAALLP